MTVTRTPLVAGDRSIPWGFLVAPHWPLKPLKVVATINREVLSETTSPDRQIQYVDIGSVDALGHIHDAEAMTFDTAPSRARRLPRAGDTIVSTVRTYLKAVAFMENPDPALVCSTGFAVLTPSRALHPKFLFYWTVSTLFVDEVCARSVGVSYPALNPSEVGQLPIPTPPLHVQRGIVEFLDRKVAVIDELAAQQERLLELLLEKRSAVIAACVGGQVSGPRRPSAVEWLGDVPASWEVVRLSYVAKVGNGATPSRDQGAFWHNGNVPWLSSGKVNEFVVREADEFITEAARRAAHLTKFPAGTVLVGMVGQGKTRGMSALMALDACINQNVAGVTPGPKLDAKYLHFVLVHAYGPLRELGQGGQQDALNCATIKAFKIPLPPLAEQRRLVATVEQSLADIEAAAASISKRVTLLREYRQALITAAVSGNLEVAGAPEEAA